MFQGFGYVKGMDMTQFILKSELTQGKMLNTHDTLSTEDQKILNLGVPVLLTLSTNFTTMKKQNRTRKLCKLASDSSISFFQLMGPKVQQKNIGGIYLDLDLPAD